MTAPGNCCAVTSDVPCTCAKGVVRKLSRNARVRKNASAVIDSSWYYSITDSTDE